jgi:hypothetical protein
MNKYNNLEIHKLFVVYSFIFCQSSSPVEAKGPIYKVEHTRRIPLVHILYV